MKAQSPIAIHIQEPMTILGMPPLLIFTEN